VMQLPAVGYVWAAMLGPGTRLPSSPSLSNVNPCMDLVSASARAVACSQVLAFCGKREQEGYTTKKPVVGLT
jgi:hypothetical protein